MEAHAGSLLRHESVDVLATLLREASQGELLAIILPGTMSVVVVDPSFSRVCSTGNPVNASPDLLSLAREIVVLAGVGINDQLQLVVHEALA